MISISVALPSQSTGQHDIRDIDLREEWNHAAARNRTAGARIDTAATDQNNLNSQSYTRLKRPAMIVRLYTVLVFEGGVFG